jgi:hypothetical protein
MIDRRIMRHGPFIQVNISSKDLSRIILDGIDTPDVWHQQ